MINRRKLLIVAMSVLATGMSAWAQGGQKQQGTGPAVQSVVAKANLDITQNDSAAAQPADAPSSSSSGMFGGVDSVPKYMKDAAPITAKYNKYGMWDWKSVPFPAIGDTVDPDFGGLRDSLYQHGMGIFIMPYITGYDNILNAPMFGAQGLQADGKYHDNSHHWGALAAQSYAGQRPTYKGSASAWLTFNNMKSGTQLVLGANENYNNYVRGSGVDDVRIGAIYVNQYFLHKKMLVAVGWYPSGYETVGMYVGGNFAGSLQGVVAILPTLAGQNTPYAPTPNSNIRYEITNHYYFTVGVQRSLSPSPLVTNWHKPMWLPFHLKGAKAFEELEIGYKRPATAGSKYIWVRLDGFLNQTGYADNRVHPKHKNTTNNWCSSDGFDFQLTQVDKKLPVRGLYSGSTIQYNPPQQNSYTQYYEWRTYYKGLLKSRPSDMTQFMVTDLRTSNIYLAHMWHPGVHQSNNNFNVAAAWVARITAGFWLNAGAEYVVHPTNTTRTPNALVATSTLQFYF